MTRRKTFLFLIMMFMTAVSLLTAPSSAPASATSTNGDEFAIAVNLNQSTQFVSAHISSGIPGAVAAITFEITYDQGNGTQTSQVQILRVLDVVGAADFAFPLTTVATVGNFMAVCNASYINPATSTVVTTAHPLYFAGIHLNDISEVAGLNAAAYQQLLVNYGLASSSTNPASTPMVSWTPTSAQALSGQSATPPGQLPIGSGMWAIVVEGPEGVLSAN